MERRQASYLRREEQMEAEITDLKVGRQDPAHMQVGCAQGNRCRLQFWFLLSSCYDYVRKGAGSKSTLGSTAPIMDLESSHI